jgi:hypothetical protein
MRIVCLLSGRTIDLAGAAEEVVEEVADAEEGEGGGSGSDIDSLYKWALEMVSTCLERLTPTYMVLEASPSMGCSRTFCFIISL